MTAEELQEGSADTGVEVPLCSTDGPRGSTWKSYYIEILPGFLASSAK